MWSRNSFCISCPPTVLSCNWDIGVSWVLLNLGSFLWFLGWMFVSQVWQLQGVCGMLNSFSQHDFFYGIWWDDPNNVVSPFQLCLTNSFQKLHNIFIISRAEKSWFCSLKTDKPYLSHTETHLVIKNCCSVSFLNREWRLGQEEDSGCETKKAGLPQIMLNPQQKDIGEKKTPKYWPFPPPGLWRVLGKNNHSISH